MTNDPSERKIDPLMDSEEQERATLAAMRIAGRGDGANEPTVEQEQKKKNSSYQSYLFGNAGSTDSPAWSDSTKGRAAIRLISRGIVGAAFFTWGGRIADRQLLGYNPDTWKWDKAAPLQAVAKGIDTILGKKIINSTASLAKLRGHTPAEAEHIANQAIRFRGTRMFKGNTEPGRSYGAEVVHFTFDFAMASVGDASTRNIIQALDPNVKKSWLVNDQGEAAEKGEHSHVDLGKWAKSTAKTGWRIFSKNQGEDWAAAIPYAFQMKFQRQFLSNVFDKRFDGHKITFDKNWNGGAYKVNHQGQVIGDYQMVGAMDLHARFVGYNWYTLMYREGYDTIANGFSKWKDDGFKINPHMPEHFNPITAAVDAAGASVRYVAKSFIKANMYMNPAVIPFWVMRVPQSKWRAGTVEVSGTGPASMHSDSYHPAADFHNPNHYQNYKSDTTFDKVEKGFSKALNPFGRFSYAMGTGATKVADKVSEKLWVPQAMRKKGTRDEIMRQYVDASLSYTPYMFAKAELGLRVDDSKGDGKPGKMDQAIYRFIDNIASFNIKGIGTSAKEMWTLGIHFEHDITGREGGDTVVAKAPVTEPVVGEASVPATTVQASSLTRHDPVLLAKGEAAEQNDASRPTDATDKRWAQMVTGGDYNAARIYPSSLTRH